ncbi:MAG: hypothetical protein H4O13_12815 [Xanthomonadales bacterium]|nr:hypothetical protein [Xanthomonadales bacterium]
MRGSALPLLLALAAPLSALAEDRPAAEVDAELLLFLAEFADAGGEVPELGLLERAQAEAEATGAAASSPTVEAEPRREPAPIATRASSSARPTPPEAEATAAERPRGDDR